MKGTYSNIAVKTPNITRDKVSIDYSQHYEPSLEISQILEPSFNSSEMPDVLCARLDGSATFKTRENLHNH